MDEGRVRWSQLVRNPGTVQLHGHHAVTVPPLGGATTDNPGLPGVRLMAMPVAAPPEAYLIDVTSTAATAMLEGFLRSGIGVGKLVSWQSRGFGRRRRDTIKINWGGNES